MEWIDREVDFPDADKILCYADGEIFISHLIESKWGYRYRSICHCHKEFIDLPIWTHWMHVPPPPLSMKCVGECESTPKTD